MSLPASNLTWYLNRLRCMQPREIPFRVHRALTTRVEGLRPLRSTVPAPDLNREGANWIHRPAQLDAAPYLAAADAIAAGRLDVFEMRAVDLGSPPRWNRDPKTGTQAPLRFGKLLDYRNPQLVGDIKYLWEPNRHLQFVTLAQAALLSGDNRYSDALRTQLRSWIAACPCGMGANWASALEPAMRLINWSAAWQLLGGMRSPLFAGEHGAAWRDEWLRSVYQHISFVRGFHSLHSSANNHLIGEATGVFVAALTWPCWKPARAWAEAAQQILIREALQQNAADGVNLEEAMGYHLWVLELLLIAWLAGRAGGMPFPDAVSARMQGMLEYLASVMDRGGHLPMYGDADDGRVLDLSREKDFCHHRSLLATGSVLFGRPELMPSIACLDDKTRWLCAVGNHRIETPAAGPGREPLRRSFTEGGHFILGGNFGTGEEIRLVVDAAPLGYGSLAAHGHADALSFTLSLAGEEFLIDPGTCSYRADTPWRAYFRGTSAHNTVRVDGMDQSQAGGSFLWLSKARSACSKWSSDADRDEIEGWQDGYMRLQDPVMHRRRISLDKSHCRLLIEDRLEMQGEHLVELFFHFSDSCAVSAEGINVEAAQARGSLSMQLPEVAGASVRLVQGQQTPPLGWISRRFGELSPSPTVCWSARLSGPAQLSTIISLRPGRRTRRE